MRTNSEYVTQIYNETYVFITKYLTIKCNSTNDVSDLLQNTYMNFLSRIEKCGQKHVFSPKHYLLRIAKDELVKYYRDKSIFSNEYSLDDRNDSGYETFDEEFLLEEFFENKDIYDQIWLAIKKQDDLTVKIFQLYFLYDMKLKEIAVKANIPISTVKNKLYRGFVKIRSLMEKETGYE